MGDAAVHRGDARRLGAGDPLERLRQRLGRRQRVQRDGAVTAGERLLYACDGPCCRGAGEGAGARSCPDVRRQRWRMAELPVHRRHAGRLERHGTMAGVRQRRAERHGERRREGAVRQRRQRRYPCADGRRLAGCGVHEPCGECRRRAPSERDRRQYSVRHDGRSERRRVERAFVAHE